MNYFSKEALQSPRVKKGMWIAGVVLVALLVFQAGVFVGYRKASFSYGWGERYFRGFGERERFTMPRGVGGMMRGGFPAFSDAHGVVGRIVSIELPTFVVSGKDGVEKVVRIATTTAIHSMRDLATSTDLKADDTVVVFGTPNADSEIEAKLIRVMPDFAENGGQFPMMPRY